MVYMKRRSVSDVIGAIILLIVIFSAAMVLLLAVGNLFTAVQDYHDAQILSSMKNKENVTLIYSKSLPPSGSPGVVVTNYGVAVNITSLIQINQNGVSYTPESIYLPSGASVPIPEPSQAAGITTSYGGIFFDNYTTTAPGLVPVSIFGEGVATKPLSGLYYVPAGYSLT
ncbi:MAG: hypothetical protein QXW57_04530, partial [Candidatus Micrarchaeaceae archaeon]